MSQHEYFKDHLKSSSDLVTPYAATRAGFVALALERNYRASPFVEQARALKILAETVSDPAKLLKIPDILPGLLTAAGVSDKASNHLGEQGKTDAIEGLIANFLEPAGDQFVEELVFRFLLTRGDTLGGSMRNVGGVLAERKLVRALIGSLTVRNLQVQYMDKGSREWRKLPKEYSGVEDHVRGLSWKTGTHARTLLFNTTVKHANRKNVDVVLLEGDSFGSTLSVESNLYLALGELKGGIDPAGADEHWKTGNSALGRIRDGFEAAGSHPHTFFLAAAIERSMALEIWGQLEDQTLSNAANLTDEDQVASLCSWLVSI